MSSIPSLSAVSAATTDPTQAPVHQTTLNQDDFLRLLVTQMTAQDPLNPMKDTEFIAQMAQFSSLEQAKSTQTDIAALRAEQQVVQANSLLGRSVTVNLADGTQTTGVVGAVQLEAGTPFVIVNGQAYDLSQLAGIALTPAGN